MACQQLSGSFSLWLRAMAPLQRPVIEEELQSAQIISDPLAAEENVAPTKELARIVVFLNSATTSHTSWNRPRSCWRKTRSSCQRRGSQSSRESIRGTPRNNSAGHWNSAPSKLRSSSSCFVKARNSHCPGQGFVAETLRDNVVNYVCRDRAEGLWQYVYEKQARVSPTPNGGARACAR